MSTTPIAPPAAAAAAEGSPEQQALLAALAELLEPVARLAVARGMPYAAVQEQLKQAFVAAAAAAHPNLAPHRKVSRIATTTGINRREVTRLVVPSARAAQTAPGAHQPAATVASELCARWRTHTAWREANGAPRVLPRQGLAPSFEALAHEITRDVHPRSLLDELCRLDLAVHDAEADTVALVGDVFVPSGDRVRMLEFLGANVGDHLRAAVDNVLASGRPPHLEQALFADGLSAESLEALRPLLREHWARLRQALVPVLEARLAADAADAATAADEDKGGAKAAAARPRSRVRLGLYAYDQLPAAAAPLPVEAGGARAGGPGGGAASARPRRLVRPRSASSDRSEPKDDKP
jgi:hypothetical protein